MRHSHRYDLLIVNLCIATILVGCTIHPKVVQSRAVAFSGGVQNAGITGYDRTGLFVNDAWLKKYDLLLETYGQKLPVSERVKSGDRTGVAHVGTDRNHVNYEVNDRYSDLKYLEHNQ